MRYLITGGCGFIGTNMSEHILSSTEDELYVVDDLSRKNGDKNLAWLRSKRHFEFFQFSIHETEKISQLIEKIKPDVIFHLAGQVAMTTSIENPMRDFQVNTLGTINILEAVRKSCPQCLVIFSSTNKVYGDFQECSLRREATRYVPEDFPQGFDESMPLSFHSPYGCSKGAADQYLLDYHRIYGIPTVVLRLSTIYGERQFATYDQGWIGWFCQKALEIKEGRLKEEFTISGDGKQVRDILHIDDLKKLFFLIAKNKEKVSGQVFNIGGGIDNSLSLLELFQLLEKSLDVKMSYRQLPFRSSDQKFYVSDLSKVRRVLGWEPVVSKESGVNRFVDWLVELCQKIPQ